MNKLDTNWTRLLLGFQIWAVIGFGLWTVLRFPIWSPIDEAHHFSFTETVATEHRLPVYLQDTISRPIVAIAEKRYPLPSRGIPKSMGFVGYSQEAFQPPAYYMLASIPFCIFDDYYHKIVILRLLGLILLLIAMAATWCIVKSQSDLEDPIPLMVFVMNLFLFPGVVVRNTTISNAALELPLVLFAFLFIWKWIKTDSRSSLIGALLLLGVMLNTRSQMILWLSCFIIMVLLLRRSMRAAAMIAVVPGIMLVPWIAFNWHHYGSPTALGGTFKTLQPYLNPSGTSETWRDVPFILSQFVSTFLPEEWCSFGPQQMSLRDAAGFLKGILYFLPALGLMANRSLIRKYWHLALPLLFSVSVMSIIVFRTDQPALPRYLHSTLPFWFLYAAFFYRWLLGNRMLIALSSILTAILILSWCVVLFHR